MGNNKDKNLNVEKILKKKQKVIEGQRIYFKILTENNATEEYCSWLNDPDVNKYLETRKTTIEQLKMYIKERLNSHYNFFWGIFLKENNDHIGNIKLEPIDYKNKVTNFGILIGRKDCWGKGYGTEATKMAVNFAFQEMGLEKVELGVISTNLSAIKAYEKSGFKLEKIELKTIRHEDKLYDCCKMSISKYKEVTK